MRFQAYEFSERKTHFYGGQWIDVARPFDGSFGVFDALLLGKRVSGRGFVMPHIDAYTLIAPWSTTATCYIYHTRW